MRNAVAWGLAALMLAAAVWIVWGTQDERAEPVPAEQALAKAPAAPRVPVRELSAPERVAAARDARPPARAPGTRAPAVELGNPPESPVAREIPERRPPLSGSGGGGAGASGVAAGVLPEDVAGLPTQTPPSAADPLEGSTPAEEPAASCALQIGLWRPQEIDARAASRMRRTGEDPEEARRHVLALLAVGYQMALAQLGADAPPAALKARAEQISFLSASLPPESYQQQLALAGNC